MPTSNRGTLIIGIFSIVLIGILDYLITVDIYLSICYLVPVLIVTKYLDEQAGILLSIICTLSWYIAEKAAKTDLSTVILIWNALVRLIVFLIVVHLMSAIKNAYEREKNLARIDSLTKIYNRRCFIEMLYAETKKSIRNQRCLTLIYFDVDNFKSVNDVFGHAKGDQLLCLIAHTVTQCIRETDVFARLGGDEFALLLPETNYESTQLVLKRIQQELMIKVKEKSFNVSFSIGAATFIKLANSVDKMLEKADSLMHQVKNNGKNSIKHELYKEQI